MGSYQRRVDEFKVYEGSKLKVQKFEWGSECGDCCRGLLGGSWDLAITSNWV